MTRTLGDLDCAQSEIDAVLGDVTNFRGVDKARAAVGVDHEAVEDVFLLDRQHLLDDSDSLSVAIVYGGAGRQCLIGDRAAGITLCAHADGDVSQLPARADGLAALTFIDMVNA